MKLDSNIKKGFTLVELLAVIVILAVIIIIEVPNISSSTNAAKKKSFQLYAQKILKSAMETYESQYSIGEEPEKTFSGNINGESIESARCYSFADLNENESTYHGQVVVVPSTLVGTNGESRTKYFIFLEDKTYMYNGVAYDTVFSGLEDIKSYDQQVSSKWASYCN